MPEARDPERAERRPARASAAASSDPFFVQPYEERSADEMPPPAQTGQATGKPAPSGRGLSPNIRARKKVAALLGGGKG